MLCPAKVNLGLKVLFKRPDNYHEIESVFLKLKWGDDIEFSPNNIGQIRLFSNNELLPSKKKYFEEVSERGDLTKNILYKTFQSAKALRPDISGVDVRLTKRIPPGGGLGGGSTNAAYLISYLFQEEKVLPKEVLQMAAKIGADVPFFLHSGHAHVSGIGEILQPIEVSQGQGILAIPPMSIDTKDSYLSLKKPLQTHRGQKSWSLLDKEFSEAIAKGEWSKLQEKFENDFEKYAFSVYPILKKLKEDLYEQGSSFASMSGTGSCIYGFMDGKDLTDALKWMSVKYPDHYFIQFSF